MIRGARTRWAESLYRGGLRRGVGREVSTSVDDQARDEIGVFAPADLAGRLEPEVMPVDHAEERHGHGLQKRGASQLRGNSRHRVGEDPHEIALHVLQLGLSRSRKKA